MSGVASAQRVGDLIVTPTRLTLDDKAKAGSITVVNRSSRPVRYRLNFVDMSMSDDGRLNRLTSASSNSAAGFLRLSPREVLLQPGESQRIRILAVVPQSIADGELRSHLSFEPIATKLQSQQTDVSGLRLSFDTRASVSIPIVVEHGKVSGNASLTRGQLVREGAKWFARFQLARTGSRTVRGDVDVVFVPAQGGKEATLGHISSLPVYFPNQSRAVSLALTSDPTTLGKGRIEVRFAETERGRNASTARLTLAPPG